MCFIKVKEEDDYSVPARPVRRERRRSPPSPRRSSRIAYIEPPRRQSPDRTYIIQAPPPPPPVIVEPRYEPAPVKPPTPPPAPVSELAATRTQSHYVEVSPGSVSSSASSSSEDVRSRTTSKSRRTDARSEYHLREREYRRERNPSPPSNDYDHYRYVRAPPERGGNGDYGRDTSRGPRTSLGAKGSFVEDPRASRTSYRRERERVVVVGNDGRRTREYRR